MVPDSVLLLSAPLGAAGRHHHRAAAAAAGGSARRRHRDAPGRSLQPPVPHGEAPVNSDVCMKYPQRLPVFMNGKLPQYSTPMI